jgi:hypothetical protein
MPMFKTPRRGREMTCLQEHQQYHHDPFLGCFVSRHYFRMPAEYRKFAQEVSEELTCTNNRQRQSSDHENENNNDESDEDFISGNMDGGEDDNVG